MTKQGEVRDWHKDKMCVMCKSREGERLSTAGRWFCKPCTDSLPYAKESVDSDEYEVMYDAEKERADQEKHNHKTARAMLNDEQVAHSITKAREKKLREAIEEALSWALNCGEYTMTEVIAILRGVLASLYPEEGEAK